MILEQFLINKTKEIDNPISNWGIGFTAEVIREWIDLQVKVKKLTIPVVVVPKGTLPNNCKVCGRTIEEMGKMTSMCGVSACPNY